MNHSALITEVGPYNDPVKWIPYLFCRWEKHWGVKQRLSLLPITQQTVRHSPGGSRGCCQSPCLSEHSASATRPARHHPSEAFLCPTPESHVMLEIQYNCKDMTVMKVYSNYIKRKKKSSLYVLFLPYPLSVLMVECPSQLK